MRGRDNLLPWSAALLVASVVGCSNGPTTTRSPGARAQLGPSQLGEGCFGEFVCAEGLFCNFDDVGGCGRNEGGGLCDVPPTECADEYDPVCGCDVQDYASPCEAHRAGHSILHQGPCDGPPATPSLAGQGCFGEFVCAAGLFCDYGDEMGCGRDEGGGLCSAPPVDCEQEAQSNPVCGCDIQDYASPCEAHRAGHSILHYGACIQ
jgi:hypothetical protein